MGVSVKTLLVDSQRWLDAEEYVQGMQPPIESQRQWGGWAETFCVASVHHSKVLNFIRIGNDSICLACGPYGHPRQRYHLCLLWSGTHYDALSLSPSTLETMTGASSSKWEYVSGLPASGAAEEPEHEQGSP